MGKLTTLFSVIPVLVFCQTTNPHTVESRFGEADGSLTSPLIDQPGKQSFTFVQNDGSFTIVDGELIATGQTTPVETDLYYRTTNGFTRALGLTMLFSYKPTTIGAGTGSQPGTKVGFSDTGVFNFTNMDDYAIGFDDSGIQINPEYGGSARLQTFMSIVQDTLYNVAVVLGGFTNVDYITNAPYYAGQDAASYANGVSIFVSVNGGKWYLRYKSTLQNVTPMTPGILQYNGTGKLDNFIITSDVPLSILEPANYISGVGTNGAQLFDYTPQQGTPWDSLQGNFTISSNYFVATGTAGAQFGYQTVKNFNTTDMYGEMVVDSDGVQFPRMVLRYDPADSTGISVLTRGDTDELEVYTVDWSTGGSTLIANVDLSSLPATDWILRASCIGNEVRAWVAGATVYNSLSVTTTFNNDATYFGFGVNNTTPDFKLIRFYKAGKEGQYDILNQLMGISVTNRRGAQ
jgi:hypothetical protein